jgi:hypothetical protein
MLQQRILPNDVEDESDEDEEEKSYVSREEPEDVQIHVYSGSSGRDELLNWIEEMQNYFECKRVEDP